MYCILLFLFLYCVSVSVEVVVFGLTNVFILDIATVLCQVRFKHFFVSPKSASLQLF